MQNEEQPVMMRLSVAEIRSRGRVRRAGYVEAVLAEGRADGDGAHWLVPLAALREVWARYGAAGLDLEHGGGCGGCDS